MDCKARLASHFRDDGFGFQTLRHLTAFTAQAMAVQGVKGRQVVKAAIVCADTVSPRPRLI